MRSTESLVAKPWWRCKKNDAHQDVINTTRFIRHHSSDRRREDVHHLELYGNRDVAGRGYARTGRTWGVGAGRDVGRMRYNLCSSAVDTAASMIAQQKPKPMYLTVEGDFGMQRQARLRSRVLEGQLEDCGAYELGPQAFVDGAITGTGAVYGYLDEDGHPKLERVLPLELMVDHSESIGGKPRSIYRQKLVAREVLQELYPKHRVLLETASGPDSVDDSDFWLARDTSVEQVVVIEAWHLKSGPNAKDGRHVICVDNCTLVDEPFNRPRFPFAFYRWKTRPLGFWGMGIVEECRDPQLRINKLIQRAERMSDLCSNAWILVDRNSKVRIESLRNDPASIIRYESAGNPPTIQTFNGTPTALLAEVATIREETFSQLGISVQTAEGKKPAGLNSGLAQRAHDDINSRRHIMNAKAYESFYMELTRVLEDLNNEAAEQDKDPELAARVTRGRATLVKLVKWGSVKLPENRYRMRVFPTSALPSTPQGKWATVQEWISSGFIDRPQAQQLLDFPDLDSTTRMELADLDKVMGDVEAMLDGNEAYPESYQDLAFALDTVRKAYLNAQTNDAPEAALQRLRDYMDDLNDLMKPPEPPPQEMAPAPGPEAMPEDIPPEIPGGVPMAGEG